MKLEEIEKFLAESPKEYGDIEWLRSRLHYHEHLTKKLLVIAYAAKIVTFNIPIGTHLRGINPLNKALEELEKE